MTEPSTFIPRPNSIAARSIELVAGRGRVLSRTLAAAIDADEDLMEASLKRCVEDGLLARLVEGGETYYAPVLAAGPADVTVVADSRPVRSSPPLPPLDRRNVAARQAPVSPDEPRRFAFGWFSDGHLMLHVGSATVTLTPSETATLSAFLRRNPEAV